MFNQLSQLTPLGPLSITLSKSGLRAGGGGWRGGGAVRL
jgi:hypothetical protein